MDGSRFDALTRSLTAPGSRRRVLAGLVAGALGLVGTGSTGARTCSSRGDVCREHANCCSGLCGAKDRTGRRRCTCPEGTVACGDACLDPATFATDSRNCGACGVRCAAGELCGGDGTQGVCGTGQGTCATGVDTCDQDGDIACNGGLPCNCVTTTSGATFCGNIDTGSCADCTTDADCTGITGIGSRCVQLHDVCILCPTYCVAPCPPAP